MATTTTITVNTADRDYSPRWHEKYDAEYKQGDGIEVCELADGDSIIRRQHATISKGTVEKHFESIEDIYVDDDGVSHLIKINVTVTFDRGDPAVRTRANDLAVGYMTALAAGTRMQELNNGTLNR